MTSFEIPLKLKEILDSNNEHSALVNSAISEFSPWLETNNVKFFIEYTDHSLKHIEGVLKTADDLIRDKCRAYITSGDVAVLVLAAFFHDCAMHMSEPGFASLIRSNRVIDGFGDKKWSQLWEEFIAESRRFSGRQLMTMFGDPDAIKPPPYEPDDLEKHDMTGKQLMLIGEFLRRHHHRLAHEIALFGVPGPGEQVLKINFNEGMRHVVDIAGLVARSHGMKMRDCLGYLEYNYDNIKDYKRIHPVFLMALLRIADILQLHDQRAPRQVEKLNKFRSPISQGEWEMHQAIEDINWTKYPETIFINADPGTANTFLRIKRELEKIQLELDSSWTTMGEVFYGEESLREFGLKIRRIRSNLDDVEKLSKKVNYVPVQAAFEVADSDLLKLLIGPLYGEDPTIGIRELMQNAIDAVLERREYVKKHPELNDVKLIEQEADVVISIVIDEEKSYVTVSDQGIGMTVDTVKNYFLKAGASLRRSEIWRKVFEDEDGNSEVLRSGRFGVGVLASYLLGDEVEVETRHIAESPEKGIHFSTQLDAENIQFDKKRLDAGTMIRIPIDTSAAHKLCNIRSKDGKTLCSANFDWFCLADPEVLVKIFYENEWTIVEQNYYSPALNSTLPPQWHRISSPDFKDIQWNFNIFLFSHLTCNGIFISSSNESNKYLDRNASYLINMPSVSVFDFNANLPLNLQRTALTQKRLPFQAELINDVLKDYIAFLLVELPFLPFPAYSTTYWAMDFRYPGIKGQALSVLTTSCYCFAQSGISFYLDEGIINQTPFESTLYLLGRKPSKEKNQFFFFKDIDQKPTQIVVFKNDSSPEFSRIDMAKSYAKSIESVCGFSTFSEIERNFKSIITHGKRVLISLHILKLIEEASEFNKNDLLSEERLRRRVVEWQNENWQLWRIGECPPDDSFFKKLAAENDGNNYKEYPCLLAEWYFKAKSERPEIKMSPLAKAWNTYIGGPVIPYDMEERKKLKGYRELKPYIDAHILLKQQREAKK